MAPQKRRFGPPRANSTSWLRQVSGRNTHREVMEPFEATAVYLRHTFPEENPLASIVKNRLREGLPYPRGATWDGKGTNFALFSANATEG